MTTLLGTMEIGFAKAQVAFQVFFSGEVGA